MVSGGQHTRDHAGSTAAPARLSLVTGLLSAQNPDGGWPYQRGTSWAEPTALALLALEGSQEAASQRARGFQWLAGRQRSDGGWSPNPGVDQSTWVTALVALLPVERIGRDRYARAVAWLMQQTGKDTTFWFRLRQKLRGGEFGDPASGWPWFPGTAAWVTPTALAMLALRKASRAGHAGLEARIQSGRDYLLGHRCADGGWNHGSSRALGYEGNSYPETTGTALLSLAGVAKVDGSLATAQRQFKDCRSAEGVNWLRMALMAHGRTMAGKPECALRNVRDQALQLLADQAEQGRNAFLD